ncbi:hypothetical protein GCM10027594_16060 [Hymenobacter agri]
MHLIGQLIQHPPQELDGHHALGAWMRFGKVHFAGAVDGHEEVLLALLRLDFGKVDAQLADGVVLKLLFRRALSVFV